MLVTDKAVILDYEAPRGADFAPDPFLWRIPVMPGVWTTGRAYAKNAIVQPWPPVAPPLLPIYLLATAAGVAGNTPPAPTMPGQVITDGVGGVTWVSQLEVSYPVDLTGASAIWVVRELPESPDPPLLQLTDGAGLTLAGNAITTFVTAAQLAVIAAVAPSAFHELRVRLFGAASYQRVFFGHFDQVW